MKCILWMSCLLFPFLSQGQNQGNIWYFGEGAGLDFNGGEPVVLTDGQVFGNPQNMFEGIFNEGSSVISNDLGELLFYSNGESIWNRNHDVMPNGSGLLGMYSSTHSALIVPQPNSDSLFYVFTTDGLERDLENGFRYSVVDMCLDEGLGDVKPDQKNVPLLDLAAEKIAAVRHANGTDIWVVTHGYNDANYYAYLLTENGLSPPVITEIGTVHEGNGFFAAIGQMKISSDGSQLAMVYSNVNPSAIELFDFDNATGTLTNFRALEASFNEYGVEFSPDGSKLYVSSLTGVHQFDLSAGSGTEAAINATKTLLTNYACAPSGMQLAPNGKIYVSRCSNFLASVEEPNNAGTACSYNENAISLGAVGSNVSLPSFLAGYAYDNSSYVCESPDCVDTVTLPCDDDDPCTLNDQMVVDAVDNSIVCEPCAGTFEADCANTMVLPCDDDDPCTINDEVTVSACDVNLVCIPCAGIVVADCTNTVVLPCDDGDDCTTNDQVTVSACDNELVCILCAGEAAQTCEETISLPCDDGDDCTENDVEIRDACLTEVICEPCAGTPIQPIDCDDLDCSNGLEIWDEESCTCITEPPIFGCTDAEACNYVEGVNCPTECDYSCLDCQGIPFGNWTLDTCGECLSPTDPTRNESCLATLYMPNSFTPDGDGLNEVFKIEYTGEFSTFEVEIYDRWGEQIFSSTSPNFAWTGSVRGGEFYAPVGVYAVQFSYARPNGEGDIIYGSVSLIR